MGSLVEHKGEQQRERTDGSGWQWFLSTILIHVPRTRLPPIFEGEPSKRRPNPIQSKTSVGFQVCDFGVKDII